MFTATSHRALGIVALVAAALLGSAYAIGYSLMGNEGDPVPAAPSSPRTSPRSPRRPAHHPPTPRRTNPPPKA